ncbi:T9SS type A sorting domain-containing protein [Flavobacterium sp.]|uniref:T9SS type A sorting domain-containing protein n=2 Tax=Flavobacterium sp. TaxID=239 RepID=UPI004048B374
MKTNFTTKTFAYLLLKGNFLASKNGIIYLMLLFSLMVQGQNVGDYRTKATGNWNAAATWETWNGSAWEESGTPTSSNGVISILNGHTVTVTENVTVDQVVIEAGGQVTLSGGTLTVSNGPGDDFIIFGTYRRTSNTTTMSINSGAIVRCANGGIYEHAVGASGASIPTITWEDESIFRFSPTINVSSSATNLNQSFGIFEINCPNQTSNNVIVTPGNVRNEFRVLNTNTGSFQLLNITINGSYVQSGGTIKVRNSSGAGVANIGGNFSLDGGTFRITDANGSSNAVTLNVDGNFTMSGGTFIFCATGSTSGPAFASIKGNVTISGGSFAGGFLRDASGFYFNGQSSEQTLTFGLSLSSGVLDRFYYRSAAGGPTGLSEIYNGTSAQNTITGSGASPGAGWSAWPTTGSLIKNLTINNPAGVTLSTAKVINTALFRTSGALSGTPNVSYASEATLHYNGTGAITTADKEFPSSNGPTNFVVSNPGGVTLHANRTLTGNLTVNNSGVLDLVANILNRGSEGGTLTLEDNTTLRIGGTGTFPTNYNTHNIATTSTVNYNGANQDVALLNSIQSYGNLTLSGSGTKTFAHATDTNIGGNFTVEGVTVTAPTRLNFNGTTAQSIAGLAYNNIEFSGTGNKTFTSNASVSPTSEITFTGTPGTVDFDGASNNLEFVLQSTVNGTARVGNTTGWTLNGQLRAERFVPAKRAWRLLTAPLKGNANNSIYANWQGTTNEGLLLWHPQGGGDTGLAVGPQSNIWSYSGTGWASVSNTNTANLYDGSTNNAYLVFATGSFGSQNISSGADATTIRAKGALITGDKDYSLIANQFKLIGNPYASPINTEVMVSDLANSGSKIWLLDPTNGLGAYVTYDGTNWSVPTPSGNDKYIQSGQAFFIRRNSNTFTVKESHKVAGNSNTWFERNANNETNLENSDRIRVLLYKQDTNNWLFADGALAVNSSSGNNNVDDTDATKISNFNESLFLRNGTTNLSIEYRALPQLGDIQALRLTGTTNGSYQLRLYTENYTNSTIQPYLEDTQTTSIYEIPTDGSEIIVPFEGVVSNSSNPITRFRLVYQSTLDTQDPTKIGVSIYPNPVDEGYLTISLDNNLSATTYALTNLLGQEVQRGNLMLLENVINVNKLPKGVYFITIKQNEKNYSKKIIFN